MNQPNLPTLQWVYHTKPSFFIDKVFFDAPKTFNYRRKKYKQQKELEEKRNAIKTKVEKEKILIKLQDLNLELATVSTQLGALAVSSAFAVTDSQKDDENIDAAEL